jgi:hypothetical protein
LPGSVDPIFLIAAMNSVAASMSAEGVNLAVTVATTATSISVLETLGKLDGEFAAMATAVENGEFALWVGSGISREAPNLGGLIIRAVEHLRQKAIDPRTRPKFDAAFQTALRYGGVARTTTPLLLAVPFEAWPNRRVIVSQLWNQYSKLLDIRIQHEDDDYLLWTAVDIRDAFKDPAPPACEHLCIAILILEGAVTEIASANWDGFIEAAVDRLSGGAAGNLQVVVDPNHLRDAPSKARLLKFHGCVIHATQDPASYRRFLTASETQITDWPNNPAFAAMRTEVISMATNFKTLMVGLSLQDNNLQSVFSIARRANAWPWPCAPRAQGHVFCEDEIGDGQRAMLKTVYADSYNDYIADIEASALLRSWPEQALLALVLKLITDKLCALLRLRLAGTAIAGEISQLTDGLHRLRDLMAGEAVGDRTAFTNRAIIIWSRVISLYRSGQLPTSGDTYEVISGSPLCQLANDQNLQAVCFGEFGIALALLEYGRSANLWSLAPPADARLSAGAISTTASRPGATPCAVFLVRSAAIALDLERRGAFTSHDTIVIHGDDVWQQMRSSATTSARKSRRAPGRTGKIRPRHVSITHILHTEKDIATLRKRFIAEAMP